MSRIVKAIQATQTGKVVASNTPLQYVDIKSDIRDIGSIACYEYAIGVKIGANVIIDKQHTPLEEAIKNVKRAVIEEIFGEFRPMLRDIEMAIMRYELHNASKLLRKLEQEMYENN